MNKPVLKANATDNPVKVIADILYKASPIPEIPPKNDPAINVPNARPELPGLTINKITKPINNPPIIEITLGVKALKMSVNRF